MYIPLQEAIPWLIKLSSSTWLGQPIYLIIFYKISWYMSMDGSSQIWNFEALHALRKEEKQDMYRREDKRV